LLLQCINGVGSNPVEGRANIWQLKNLILILFALIFRRIDIYIYIYIYKMNIRSIYIYKCRYIYICVCTIFFAKIESKHEIANNKYLLKINQTTVCSFSSFFCFCFYKTTWQLKNLILILFALIFRRIDIYIYIYIYKMTM
jgi:hypothetical protein